MEVIAQLRTTDLEGSIRFYTERLGLALDFRWQDFYAGIRAGARVFPRASSWCATTRDTPSISAKPGDNFRTDG